MTVSTTSNKVSFSANGSTTVFAYNFKIFADADLTVIIRAADGTETTKTLTTHYTVSGAGSSSGGNVTFTTGNTPANGETVVIKRELAVTQSTDYVANDPFPAASHEDALDRLTMIAQQQTEQIGRSIVFPDTDTAATTIPSSVTRANKFLGFGSSGEVAVLSSTGTSPGAIDTGNLVDSAVTSAKLAANSVTSAKIVDGTIATADIADDAVNQAKIADDAVGTAQIADDAVGSAQIADDAVGQAAIANNAVGTNQIADSAVTAAKLSSDAAFTSGMLMPFAGSAAPSGWLLAYGQAVSRSTYSSLFTAIGTTYGAGDGSSTFNLPDLRGRVVAGQDDMGGVSADNLTNVAGDGLNGDTLGATGGAESHVITTTQMPSHSHTLNGGLKTASSGGNSSASGLVIQSFTQDQGNDPAGTVTTGNTNFDNFSIASNGSGAAHNNVQPTIILNYIIKT